MKTKVLYVMHNHPAVYPGGAEQYAYELYCALRDSAEIEPLLVARIGPGPDIKRLGHPGAPFSLVRPDDPNQFFFHTSLAQYSFFLMTSQDKRTYATYLAEFLKLHRPDVVHFQHTQFIGYDAISHTRRVLPDVPIVCTLHEYLAICHRDGQMLRTNGELCTHASPRRCHECFDYIPPQQFFLRERFIKSHLQDVDMFLAPSRFLLNRYVAWGIPREKIRFEDYGRLPPQAVAEAERPAGAPRNRLGFFGQFNEYKGITTLIKAITILNERGVEVDLSLHGANLEIQPQEFQEEFRNLLARSPNNITMRGRYRPEELPHLMADVDWVVVPSKWWENSPLVIQEAFMHGRPVICSDIGGMAEKVTDGVNGLHFRVGNAASLADTIQKAVTTPHIWDILHAGLPTVYGMEAHIGSLADLYSKLLESRSLAAPELVS